MLRASATKKRWKESVSGILFYNLKKNINGHREAGRVLKGRQSTLNE
jgi:hypothetical protein